MITQITEEQLLELQRLATLGRLLASVAHEFSAPIASILSNTEIEMRVIERLEHVLAEPSPGVAKELVAICRSLVQVDRLACERITALVKSLKTAARAGAAEFQRVNVNEIADAALQLAKTEFRGRIGVETDFGELPEVECYPHLLSQALLNLLTNAGQAIDGTGTVTVGTRAEGERAHIWVTDTGRGIPDEDRPKILQRGFTTKPLGIGTGLGLSIVRQIVAESHGGAIDFESELGKGTTFHVLIPIEQKRKGA